MVGFDFLFLPNALSRTIRLTILLRNVDQALQIHGSLTLPSWSMALFRAPSQPSAFEPEPPSHFSTTLADPLDRAIITEPEEHVPSLPRTPTRFTASDFKKVFEEERRPTPRPETKSASELGPAAAQPEPECTPTQETTSLPPTTNPASPPSSKGLVAFTPTRSPRSPTPSTSRSPCHLRSIIPNFAAVLGYIPEY